MPVGQRQMVPAGRGNTSVVPRHRKLAPGFEVQVIDGKEMIAPKGKKLWLFC